MAGLSVTIRVVVVACPEADLVDAIAGLVTEHEPGPEGIVPAILAEEIVGRLRARHVILVHEDTEA